MIKKRILGNSAVENRYSMMGRFYEKDFRAIMPQFQDESYKQNEELFYLVSSIAEEKNATACCNFSID